MKLNIAVKELIETFQAQYGIKPSHICMSKESRKRLYTNPPDILAGITISSRAGYTKHIRAEGIAAGELVTIDDEWEDEDKLARQVLDLKKMGWKHSRMVFKRTLAELSKAVYDAPTLAEFNTNKDTYNAEVLILAEAGL